MLNIQAFNDVDGNRVEVDRREVIDAYVEQRDGSRLIRVTHGRAGIPVSLGIGALAEVEAWLGMGTLRVVAARLGGAAVRTVGL